ncbi:MAG: hypothetical protein J5601_02825 [Elusimicrobiaceae bacterium]|nr:hypothetical protein [Elusimicrobiaceae bacterium]
MFKKYFLFFLTCLWLLPSAQAQLRLGKGARSAFRSERATSKLLSKRVKISFEKAQYYQGHYPSATSMLGSSPFSSVSPALKNPEQMYPQMTSLLNTPKDWVNYILSNQNRRFTANLLYMKQKIRYLEEHFNELYQAQHVLSVPVSQYAETLLQHIPEDAQYILLGESHSPSIRREVAKLMAEIGKKYKGREVIFLTEFSYEGDNEPLPWSPGTGSLSAVFDAVNDMHMPVIGLEPAFVQENIHLKLTAECGEQPFWASLEGIALRNQHWIKTIQQQRQQHPDALFIIYAGVYHLLYGNPYSIANALPADKTFNIALLSTDLGGIDYLSPFDDATLFDLKEIYPFVLFDKPQANIVGFDARIFFKESF